MITHTLIAATIVLAHAAAVHAQPPQLSNARVETHAVEGSLEREFHARASRITDPAWIGYAVPAANRDARLCCSGGDDCCTGCRLEPGAAGRTFVTHGAPGAARLEGGGTLLVFYRVEGGQVDRIRMFSDDCAIHAGGRAVHWLTGASGAGSVALLAALSGADASRRVANGALAAIAMHGDPAAIERLIAIARTGGTAHVRGQALFWLGQRASTAAIGAIRDAIDEDPDTDVKRRAVFALSQLPADEGLPRLIDVARTHSNQAVRRQAMFWLGQSKDPRALSFFEEILKP
jgi:hypothetical protein